MPPTPPAPRHSSSSSAAPFPAGAKRPEHGAATHQPIAHQHAVDSATAPRGPRPPAPVTPAPSSSTWERPERTALLGVIVNAGLAAIKLLGGLLGNSFALIADAVESMADIAGSLVIWGALHYGNRAPDDEHPFGHGKAEALAALGVSLMIVVAGIGIAVSAIEGLVEPRPVPAPFTLLILGVVIVVKEVMFRVARRSARPRESSAGFADAWHHRSDAITSAAALVGVSIAVFGGPAYVAADSWAALIASTVIVVNGGLLLRAPFAELMDQSAPHIAERCAALTLEVGGIRAIEQCVARKSGRGYRVIMHAEVDSHLTVAAAHALTGMAKAHVRHHLPEVTSLLIHVEPYEPPAESALAT